MTVLPGRQEELKGIRERLTDGTIVVVEVANAIGAAAACIAPVPIGSRSCLPVGRRHSQRVFCG